MSPQVSYVKGVNTGVFRRPVKDSISHIPICLIPGESTEREPKQPFTTLPFLPAQQFHSGD